MRAQELIAAADVLIEGNRPGLMERLGLGPADCAARNPRLVYDRMTGWGQHGPLSQAADHDLNYVALTGLLSLATRNGQPPVVAPTVMGDADGGFVTVGAIEPQFYGWLLSKLQLDDVDPTSQYDKAQSSALKARFTALFRSQPRDHWCALLEGSDVCFAPAPRFTAL